MSCRSEFNHQLYDLAAGLLKADAAKELEAHIARCDDCRRELAGMKRLAADLAGIEKATRIDLSAEAADELLRQANTRLSACPRSACSRPAARQVAEAQVKMCCKRIRPQRRNWSRFLVPLAAAVLLIAALQLLPLIFDPAPATALDRLARQADRAATVADIHKLAPSARKALDVAMTAGNIDAGKLANLQLIHYISGHAVEAEQVRDVRFLIDLTRQEPTEPAVTTAVSLQNETDLIDRLSALFERQAMAAASDVSAEVRRLIVDGKYDRAWTLLSANAQDQAQPIAAYAAIRAGQLDAARQMLDEMAETAGVAGIAGIAGVDEAIVSLLRAELALSGADYAKAVDSFGRVAGAQADTLWFHAGYLAKYELHDEALAADLFRRSSSPRLVAYAGSRFGYLPGDEGRILFSESFQTHPLGNVPQGWRLIPAHEGEFEIAEVDGSRVLVMRESGFPQGRLSFGNAGLSNYAFSCDFKVIKADPEALINLTVYDSGLHHYALKIDGRNLHLLRRQLGGNAAEPAPSASAELEKNVTDGNWWHAVVEVRTLDTGRTQLRARVWPRGARQADGRQMEWVDVATEGRSVLERGKVGLRVAGANVAFDNLKIRDIGRGE